MKIKKVLEGSISDFSAGKRRRELMQKRKSQRDQDASNLQMFSSINTAINETIDFLINSQGMNEEAAKKAVLQYLSDLVMAHDIN